MNRRNVLIGLGTVAAGGGAVLGSGAFSQVEAERTVNVNSDADASALLALAVASTTLEGAEGSADEVIAFELGNGVNLDAVTRFDGAFEVTNNSDDAVDVAIEDAASGDSIVSGDAAAETTAGLYFEDSNGDLTGLASGATAVLDVVFNLDGVTDTATADSSIPDNVTIRATQP